MIRTGFRSATLYGNGTKELKDVTSLTVSNYSDVPFSISINDVKRTIPAFDPALKVPYYFNIPGDGTYSDIKISWVYVGGKAGQAAILDYRSKEEC